ncbi:MAG TPA: hypothetical protein VGG85_19050 [Terracidiphilus sp.]|jgi:hypothetical protein
MSETNHDSKGSPRIPVDGWAVALALTLVALVRLGWFPKISW